MTQPNSLHEELLYRIAHSYYDGDKDVFNAVCDRMRAEQCFCTEGTASRRWRANGQGTSLGGSSSELIVLDKADAVRWYALGQSFHWAVRNLDILPKSSYDIAAVKPVVESGASFQLEMISRGLRGWAPITARLDPPPSASRPTDKVSPSPPAVQQRRSPGLLTSSRAAGLNTPGTLNKTRIVSTPVTSTTSRSPALVMPGTNPPAEQQAYAPGSAAHLVVGMLCALAHASPQLITDRTPAKSPGPTPRCPAPLPFPPLSPIHKHHGMSLQLHHTRSLPRLPPSPLAAVLQLGEVTSSPRPGVNTAGRQSPAPWHSTPPSITRANTADRTPSTAAHHSHHNSPGAISSSSSAVENRVELSGLTCAPTPPPTTTTIQSCNSTSAAGSNHDATTTCSADAAPAPAPASPPHTTSTPIANNSSLISSRSEAREQVTAGSKDSCADNTCVLPAALTTPCADVNVMAPSPTRGVKARSEQCSPPAALLSGLLPCLSVDTPTDQQPGSDALPGANPDTTLISEQQGHTGVTSQQQGHTGVTSQQQGHRAVCEEVDVGMEPTAVAILHPVPQLVLDSKPNSLGSAGAGDDQGDAEHTAAASDLQDQQQQQQHHHQQQQQQPELRTCPSIDPSPHHQADQLQPGHQPDHHHQPQQAATQGDCPHVVLFMGCGDDCSSGLDSPGGGSATDGLDPTSLTCSPSRIRTHTQPATTNDHVSHPTGTDADDAGHTVTAPVPVLTAVLPEHLEQAHPSPGQVAKLGWAGGAGGCDGGLPPGLSDAPHTPDAWLITAAAQIATSVPEEQPLLDEPSYSPLTSPSTSDAWGSTASQGNASEAAVPHLGRAAGRGVSGLGSDDDDDGDDGDDGGRTTAGSLHFSARSGRTLHSVLSHVTDSLAELAEFAGLLDGHTVTAGEVVSPGGTVASWHSTREGDLFLAATRAAEATPPPPPARGSSAGGRGGAHSNWQWSLGFLGWHQDPRDGSGGGGVSGGGGGAGEGGGSGGGGEVSIGTPPPGAPSSQPTAVTVTAQAEVAGSRVVGEGGGTGGGVHHELQQSGEAAEQQHSSEPGASPGGGGGVGQVECELGEQLEEGGQSGDEDEQLVQSLMKNPCFVQ